ncbi:DUF5707 domain-containing protein [Streptomyces viridosporus]|uniref:DUF5707 domain-containing protein n=1 Tax=Streptomyces viridosporus TaxID=67581 RepID=UPI0036FE437B
MSQRALVSSLIGVAVVGGVTAGGIAMASPGTAPALKNGSARYTAPSGDRTGSLTFTVDAADDSGVENVKVVARSARSKLDPAEEEMRHVEDATCRSISDVASRCTYTLEVTRAEAAEPTPGTWYVSALMTAEDGDTAFAPHAAGFDVTG